jgi:murein DD-endopeptidase MepM/ murein hydrolase activator NlpD
MRSHRGWLVVLSLAALGCGEANPPCTGYPSQAASEYVLPWPAGQEYAVLTGNCREGNATHSGDRRYAYDFRMPIGTIVTAARAGRVVFVVESFSDDDHEFGHENVVTVSHADGTFALYIHLARAGALVNVGDTVVAGDPIGILGTSGSIGRDLIPHLHFETASQTSPILSVPVVFRNTRAHPNGLVEGQSYRAEGF